MNEQIIGFWAGIKKFFGDVLNGNYSEFESDGTLVAKGEARTWVDIDYNIVIRTTGPNIPTQATVKGNLTMPQWAVGNFNVCEIQETVHPYAESTNFFWHIHIITAVSDTTDRYLNWEIEFNGSNIGEAWSATNSIQTSTDYLIPANTPAFTNLIIPIYTMPGTGVKIGSHYKARLRRIASIGTAPSVNPFCEMLQIHILTDMLGSRNIGTK